MTDKRRREVIAVTSFVGLMACSAIGAAQETPKKFVDAPEPTQRQGFSVVLLLGDVSAAAAMDAVPPAAQRALLDMKDFLPYKSYRVLDTQWTLCCSGGSGSVITRLRGFDDQEYELELRSGPTYTGNGKVTVNTSRLAVRFFLREPADVGPLKSDEGKLTADHPRTRELVNKGLANSAVDTRIAEINREIFALERERVDLAAVVANGREKVEIGTEDPLKVKRSEDQLAMIVRRLNVLKSELTGVTSSKSIGRTVIDTSFQMDVGETVVVGTSRLKGGSKALIAVLTAVSSRGKKTE